MKTISQYKGLPARYYTDQVFFNYEQERLWGNKWQLVGRENEISQAGAGVLTVHNVCTHRGAKLLHGQGNCKQAIVCPYLPCVEFRFRWPVRKDIGRGVIGRTG